MVHRHCCMQFIDYGFGFATDKLPAGNKPAALKSVLEGLEDLWDENQYAEEFSLQSFTSKLSAGKWESTYWMEGQSHGNMGLTACHKRQDAWRCPMDQTREKEEEEESMTRSHGCKWLQTDGTDPAHFASYAVYKIWNKCLENQQMTTNWLDAAMLAPPFMITRRITSSHWVTWHAQLVKYM